MLRERKQGVESIHMAETREQRRDTTREFTEASSMSVRPRRGETREEGGPRRRGRYKSDAVQDRLAVSVTNLAKPVPRLTWAWRTESKPAFQKVEVLAIQRIRTGTTSRGEERGTILKFELMVHGVAWMNTQAKPDRNKTVVIRFSGKGPQFHVQRAMEESAMGVREQAVVIQKGIQRGFSYVFLCESRLVRTPLSSAAMLLAWTRPDPFALRPG
ncbi:hypothetical protein B0H11DRAFT_2389211 [Mycena galericulata]|nr:hypothetical protein B0H11DRAFT_2389211 [Mycena galericulata]